MDVGTVVEQVQRVLHRGPDPGVLDQRVRLARNRPQPQQQRVGRLGLDDGQAEHREVDRQVGQDEPARPGREPTTGQRHGKRAELVGVGRQRVVEASPPHRWPGQAGQDLGEPGQVEPAYAEALQGRPPSAGRPRARQQPREQVPQQLDQRR